MNENNSSSNNNKKGNTSRKGRYGEALAGGGRSNLDYLAS
jgi:hypothetical protein